MTGSALRPCVTPCYATAMVAACLSHAAAAGHPAEVMPDRCYISRILGVKVRDCGS